MGTRRNVIGRSHAFSQRRHARKRLPSMVVVERSGRHMVEVAATHEPLIDAMRKVPVELATVPGRMLGEHGDDDLYVCGRCVDRGAAVQAVMNLLDQSFADTKLRETMGSVGIPRATQLSDGVFVWWPNVRGQTHTIH